MRVLAFRHVPFEGLGLVEPALTSRGIHFDYADLYAPGAPAPNPEVYDGLIVLGGPMSANDPLPFLAQEITFLQNAIARHQPVLGICLGSQLIARALGAAVYRNPVREIGWFDLHFTEAAQSDALFADLTAAETVFHWHSDTFDLPPASTWLARSDRCRHQAFRYGANVYGLQFHLEVTPTMIADWTLQDENCGDVRELDAAPDPQFNRARLDTLAAVLFGRWCDLLTSNASISIGG